MNINTFTNISVCFFLIMSFLAPTISASETETVTKHLWLNLDKTNNQCPEELDYFPEGGLRTFYCHAKTFLSYEKLQQLSPLPIFSKGPHSKTQLNLAAKNDFGYYNKDFVKWLRENAIPAAQNPRFKALTRSLYHQYVKPLARAYYVVHERLMADSDYLQKEQETYFKLIEAQSLPEYYVDNYFAELIEQGFNLMSSKPACRFGFGAW